MDLKAVLAGLHHIHESEIARFADRKLVALRSAFTSLYGSEASGQAFCRFLGNVPPSVLGTYFGSDGIDQHYTRLLGGLAVGERDFDAVLALTLNFILGELTYQGRYLAKYEPEPLIVAGGSTLLLQVALANAEKIESFKVGVYDESDLELLERMDKLALNYRALVWGSPETLAKSVTTALGRPLGCLAILDIGLPDQCALSYESIAAPLERHFHDDMFHLFAGDVDSVYRVREQLHQQFPSAHFLHRAYGLDRGGAEVGRSVLVATGVDRLPSIELGRGRRRYHLCPRGSDFALAQGLSSAMVREDEEVRVQPPKSISSSAPIARSQIDIVTKPVLLNHRMTRLGSGRVINSTTIFAHCYIIATSADQIFEEMHLPELITHTPYGKPDENGVIDVPSKPVGHVVGPALLFSFSPGIVGYHSHFLLQCFPRIITAEHLGIPDLRLLIPSQTKKYQLEMLEMAGWGSDRLVVMDQDFDYVCDELYIPNISPAVFSPFQAVIYDRLIDKVRQNHAPPWRRILISRAARTTWRNMVNYDAVCDLLVRDCGFEIVAPDKLSIEDEINLFQSSAIVIGAEGAGLYNCCFMAAGTDVIVLADQDYVMYVVGSMAAIRGFDVSFVFGESFQADRDLARRAGHADFVVDPVRVKEMVEDVIARKQLGS